MTLISDVRRGQNFIQRVFSTLRKFLKIFKIDLLCHVATLDLNVATSDLNIATLSRCDVGTLRRCLNHEKSALVTSRRWISTSQHWLPLFWTTPCHVAMLASTSQRQLAPLSGTSGCGTSTS